LASIDEKILDDLICKANVYLSSMDKNHVCLNTFNNKLIYDIHKLKNNKNNILTWCCFINETVNINKELIIINKKYKLLGAIFWSWGPHYTFASYDDKGNVCRYYDDEKIFKEIQNNITLERNGKLLLYKEV
jgi:hypothetical protein